jgi:hypothetical protein
MAAAMSQQRAARFRTLAVEAIRDAVRRRIVAVIAGVSILSLMLVDRCTSFGLGTLIVGERAEEAFNFAGWTSTVTFVMLGLWSIVLAGVLASEHLAHALADGSAALCLARPVGRGMFALARLAGALAVAIATGAVLLGATAFFVHTRHDLALGPAALAGLACTLGAITAGALAMTASLYIPRIASVLLVFAGVATITITNTVSLFGGELTGIFAAVDRYGPPLCTALVLALAPWIEPVSPSAAAGETALLLALWTLGSVLLLRLAFRRMELAA